MTNFLVTFLVLLGIYSLLTSSLSLLVGHTGIFSLAHAAIFGVGAYTSAILTVTYGMPFLAGLIGAVIVGSGVSALMAIPSLRVAGDYFIVASLGMQVVIETVLRNAGFTGGEAGFRGILAPRILGITFRGSTYLGLVAAVVLVSLAGMYILTRSPYGRVLHAIRADESVAEALGKNVNSYKVSVTIFAGAIAAIAGSLYAHFLTFLSPRTFGFGLSIYLFMALLVGGRYRIGAVVGGTAVVVLMPEILKRVFDIPASLAGPAYQMLFGAILVLLMFVRPQGVFGRKAEA